MLPPAATTLELTERIHAPPAQVWQALTEPEPRWLGFRFETSWRVGEAFAIVGTLNGKDYREPGTLLVLDPERTLSYDHFSRLWRVPDRPENHAVMTLSLEPTEDGTLVRYHHALPAVIALAQHANFFWRGALYSLRQQLEGAPG